MTWGTDRFGEGFAPGDGRPLGDGTAEDPGIDHRTRRINRSEDQTRNSGPSDSPFPVDRTTRTEERTRRGSGPGKAFEERFREVQRESEGTSGAAASSFRDMSFARVDHSTPVRGAAGRINGMLGVVGGSSEDEETVDSELPFSTFLGERES